ncbi:MAG: hypothetical protein V3V05_10360, partial [Pontiella sp.]
GATFLLLHADAPILVCGELKKGSFWHGALDFQTGHFNLQSTHSYQTPYLIGLKHNHDTHD